MVVPEVLTEENYEVWKIFMKSYLLGKGLWDMVEGSECKPEPTNPEFKAWRMRNGEALHAIMISCGEKVLFLIREKDSAKDAWDHLASMFQQNTKGKKILSSEAESLSKETKSVSKVEPNLSEENKFPSKPQIYFLHKQLTPSHSGTSSVGQAGEEAAANPAVRYRALYQAVYLGDWKRTKNFLEEYPDSMTAIISPELGTVLHVAVTTGNLHLVKKLLEFMSPDAINIATRSCKSSPLNIAASCGFTKIAEVLVEKSKYSLHIRNDAGHIPVVAASVTSHKDTTRYLYAVTKKEEFEGDEANAATLLNGAILSDLFDIAIDLLCCYPRLAITYDFSGYTTIEVLALRPNAFASAGLDSIWQQWIYSSAPVYKVRDIYSVEVGDTYKDQKDHIGIKGLSHTISFFGGSNTRLLNASRWLYAEVWNALNLLGIKNIQNKKKIHAQALKVLKCTCSQLSSVDERTLQALGVYDSIFRATQSGIVEIVSELAKINPELLFIKDNENRNIFSLAIMYRQEKIFNFLRTKSGQMAAFLRSKDNDANTLLHFAGISSPLPRQGKIAGAALQTQRELQWFQEVKKILSPISGEATNNGGLKPHELFTKQHKELLKEGETWMKDTANSCMVVATLIATFTFAAAFTVPGGNNDLGFPIFLRRKIFLLFIISDALSLFSSSTSVLMFLSIYTSRYAEEDFLKSLPKRLIIGLSTLFFSIATMMVAFCATMFLTLGGQYQWVAIPITFLASVPVSLFILLQFPLFHDMILSTSGLPFPSLSLLVSQFHYSFCYNSPSFMT